MANHSVFVIGDTWIEHRYKLEQKLNATQPDSGSQLLNPRLYSLATENNLIKPANDSLLTPIYFIDTIFQMNNDNIVRRFKSYYFLNNRYDHEIWEVNKIEVLKGQQNWILKSWKYSRLSAGNGCTLQLCYNKQLK